MQGTLDLDIRDIKVGDTYYVVTSKERGGRCIMNGMFIAAWRTKAEARAFANGNPDLTVVKSLRA